MWKNDITTEVICQLSCSKQELAPTIGNYFLDDINDKPVFLPSKDIINSFREKDIPFFLHYKNNSYIPEIRKCMKGLTTM